MEDFLWLFQIAISRNASQGSASNGHTFDVRTSLRGCFFPDMGVADHSNTGKERLGTGLEQKMEGG
jgi:hypothetical protein